MFDINQIIVKIISSVFNIHLSDCHFIINNNNDICSGKNYKLSILKML